MFDILSLFCTFAAKDHDIPSERAPQPPPGVKPAIPMVSCQKLEKEYTTIDTVTLFVYNYFNDVEYFINVIDNKLIKFSQDEFYNYMGIAGIYILQ